MHVHDPAPDIRPAREADLPVIHDVWYLSDVTPGDLIHPPAKRSVPAYLRHVLQTGTLLVAEQNGAVVAYAGAVRRGTIAYLTDLFVHPLHQSSGVGRTLLQAVLPSEDGLVHCTLSSGDPRALALYIRAGMAPQWPYVGLRLESPLPTGRQIPPDVAVSEAPPSDLPELIRADQEWSGRYRPEEHTFWVQEEQAMAVWFRRHDQPIGYGYIRLGAGTLWHPEACTIGPIGVGSAEDATSCVLAAVEWAVQRAPVTRIGVPGPHGSLAPLLERGFRITYIDTFVSSAPAAFFDPRCYIPSGGDLL